MMQKRLSIGILVESYNVPNWVYTMLEKILIDDCAQIVAVVVNSSYNALEQDKTTYNLFERIFYSARGCGRYLGHPKQPIQDFVGTPMDFYFPVTF